MLDLMLCGSKRQIYKNHVVSYADGEKLRCCVGWTLGLGFVIYLHNHAKQKLGRLQENSYIFVKAPYGTFDEFPLLSFHFD